MEKSVENIRRIAFYCRNSTTHQDYEYQIEQLNKELARYRDCELIHIYSEKISGFKSEEDRPEMKTLLTSVENGELDEVWVNEFTRLSRDAENLMSIVKRCAAKKVCVFFKQQDLRSLNNKGELTQSAKVLIAVLSQFAEFDAEKFRSLAKEGKYKKTLDNKYVGGILPLGYTYDETTKRLLLDAKEKEVVEYIFNSYCNGHRSLNKIADDLNHLMIVDEKYVNKIAKHRRKKTNNRKYNQWSAPSIRGVLKSTWYALGYRMYKGEKIMLSDDLKFISLPIYERAQELLSNNKVYKKAYKHTYLLSGLLYCSCGEKMFANASGGKDGNMYYCDSKRARMYNSANVSECKGKQIAIEKIENAIWLLVKNKLYDFKLDLNQQVDKREEILSQIQQNNDLIKAIQSKSIIELKERRKRTINTYNRYGGDASEFDKEINEIDVLIKKEERGIVELESRNKELEISISDLNLADELEKHIKEIEADRELVQKYLKKLIKRVTVMPKIEHKAWNVLKIEWATGIHEDKPTFLFYNPINRFSTPFYYFISGEVEIGDYDEIYYNDTTVEWDIENSIFHVFETKQINNRCVASIDELVDKCRVHYEMFRATFKDKLEGEFSDYQFPAICLDEEKEKCAVLLGCQPLEIVIPFPVKNK